MKINLLRRISWLGMAATSGALAGVAASIFLILLDLATRYRVAHPQIIWALPLAGFIIGWFYFKFGRTVVGGNNLILDEIHDPKKVIPVRLVPLALFGTVITHLFGGSAGREGTAVQMGASLADQVSKFFKVEMAERKILLVAGAGAGFGAAIGAPFAGTLFGMEVIRVGRLKLFAPVECFLASFVAFFVTKLLHAPHSYFPLVNVPNFTPRLLVAVILAGLAFGLAARLFIFITHEVERVQARWVGFPPLKPVTAGLVLCGLYWLEGSYRYAGLGIDVIQNALTGSNNFAVPAWKLILTAITVGSGFKGGEFIPLVFIGTTLGSSIAPVLGAPGGFIAALGFAAVFAAGANTPLSCAVMAVEIFGPSVGLYAVIACLTSSCVTGERSLYRRPPIKR